MRYEVQVQSQPLWTINFHNQLFLSEFFVTTKEYKYTHEEQWCSSWLHVNGIRFSPWRSRMQDDGHQNSLMDELPVVPMMSCFPLLVSIKFCSLIIHYLKIKLVCFLVQTSWTNLQKMNFKISLQSVKTMGIDYFISHFIHMMFEMWLKFLKRWSHHTAFNLWNFK